MSEQYPSPAEGVMHGPYPKAESRLCDPAHGREQAINEALAAGRIDLEKATELRRNLDALYADIYINEPPTEY